MTSHITRGSLVLCSLVAAASVVGCAPAEDARAPHGHALTAAERDAKIEQLLSRENAPAKLHAVRALDGLAQGEIESIAEPRVECKTEDGDKLCFVDARLGKNDDGTDAEIGCIVSTRHDAFGIIVKKAIGEAQLTELPTLTTSPVGEGLAVKFQANAVREASGDVFVGTAKVAMLHAHGFAATCFDTQAGGRKTFARVVDHFFASMKFAQNPAAPAVLALGYHARVGDRTFGYRFDTIAERASEPGFVEVDMRFWLETDGKAWAVRDGAAVIERDDKGAIQKMANLLWVDGKGPLVVSAKPGEDRKFRLKFEVGEKSSGLESTPKAPLNSDVWAAPELARVASGAQPSYRFAFLDVIDSDPSFHYLTLTRSAPGVLLEGDEQVSASGKKPAKAQAAEHDELHVDGRGVVTKEVSTHATTELVSSWGELPAVIAPKGGARAKTASRSR